MSSSQQSKPSASACLSSRIVGGSYTANTTAAPLLLLANLRAVAACRRIPRAGLAATPQPPVIPAAPHRRRQESCSRRALSGRPATNLDRRRRQASASPDRDPARQRRDHPRPGAMTELTVGSLPSLVVDGARRAAGPIPRVGWRVLRYWPCLMPGSAQASSTASSGWRPGMLRSFLKWPVGRIVRLVTAVRHIARTT